MTAIVAALFVDVKGPYWTDPRCDCWDEKRDARNYRGPLPVVAHPPCQRWGRYWFGGPSVLSRKILGDDDGCFASALHSVRSFGGVLEHPEASHAWRVFAIPAPPKTGGWRRTICGGFTCCIEQGNYGHRARKATWLYYVGRTAPPEMVWGPASGKIKLDDGFHSKEERAARRDLRSNKERLSHVERRLTPPAFADALINLAANCGGAK